MGVGWGEARHLNTWITFFTATIGPNEMPYSYSTGENSTMKSLYLSLMLFLCVLLT